MLTNYQTHIDMRAAQSIMHCVYCGETVDLCRDHVIPTSYLRTKRRYEGDWLVTACQECNRTLGSELIFNVPDRALWVETAYRKKYRKLAVSPIWDDDELEELGHSLRSMIVNTMKAKAILQRRLAYLKMVTAQPITYMANLRPAIDPEIEDVPEFIDDDLSAKRERRSLLRTRARARFKYAEDD